MKPYKEQLDAIEKAASTIRGGIVMPTGSGKSVTMALLINHFQLKTLVIVPSLELKRQLSESFLKFFGTLKNITIENIDSKQLKKYDNFDLLLIDECQHVASKTYRDLNKKYWNNIYYRFFFSATFFRNDIEEQLLFTSIAGEPIYELSYKSAVNAGLICSLEAYYVEIPKQKTDAYTWAEVYKELVVNNTSRNIVIIDLLTKLHTARVSTLCLVKEVAHGQLLSDITGLPFVNGLDEDSRKYIKRFNNKQISVLIATTGIMGEGIDSKPAEFVIIAGLGKAKSAFMQQVGRVLRTYEGKKSGKVIIIKDKSHRFCTRHFNEQCKILETEYGIKPIKLEV